MTASREEIIRLYYTERARYDGSVAGCPDVDTVGALVAGALAGHERAAIANHAATCAACHALIAGLELSTASVSGDAPPTDETTLDLHRGMRVGRYVIEGRLGAGGMGVVHAAFDGELQRRVAIKLLRGDRDAGLDGVDRRRLLREARTLARLSHPNVVTVYEVGEHAGHVYLAMELVDGGSLETWLRTKPKTADIVDRLLEVARALGAAHEAGIVHRDVKPSNILVGRDGRARLTDFGLAHLVGEPSAPSGALAVAPDAPITRTGALLGTPAYMSPEQLRHGETNATTDQWSFCATMYEALAGVRPFTVADLDRAERLAAPAPGRRVALRAIVRRGLARDPARRWPSMRALANAIERRRHLARNAAIATAILVLAAVAAAFALRPRDEPEEVRVPDIAMGGPMWPDRRPGCDCPYSACRNGCAGVCRAHGFTHGQPVPGVSLPKRQEALCGASSDGANILYLAGERCALDHLYLAHQRGATYESIDLTPQLDPNRVAIVEACCTLAADASGAIVLSRDQRTFYWLPLSGDTVGRLDDAPFAGLFPGPPEHRTLSSPVLTADGLTLYYVIHDQPAGSIDPGPVNGIYAATRRDLHSPFERPYRLPGKPRMYEYVSGVTTDNLTLFLTSDFSTYVVSRADPTEPFTGAEGAQWIYGWRAVPLANCGRVLTTASPGGCAAEDIIFLDAQP